ncbi:hypothetical protein DNI29_17635 [Hymenobacter sediminis]|nr:hypothetical protein DNI29_17635 [Hymenobacter sediminis]
MSIETSIDIVGGIRPLQDRFCPLNEAEIAELEKAVGARLPQDYVWLLQTYGEFIFRNSVGFAPLKSDPEYKHPEELGIPNGSIFKGSGIATVYGKNTHKGVITILEKLKMYQSRMPEQFLPFADDGMGNQLCLALVPENYQNVYWWDHELEWDEEDYEDETGSPMPNAAKFQNVYLVANSLTELFEKLVVWASATS